jgi:hypothetical protein
MLHSGIGSGLRITDYRGNKPPQRSMKMPVSG